MAILLVTFDLHPERSNRAAYARIETYIQMGVWAQLTESCYAIETIKKPKQVHLELMQFLEPGDRLLVAPLTGPWWGSLDAGTTVWLSGRLKPDN